MRSNKNKVIFEMYFAFDYLRYLSVINELLPIIDQHLNV